MQEDFYPPYGKDIAGGEICCDVWRFADFDVGVIVEGAVLSSPNM